LRGKRRQKQSLKRLKILITECKDRGASIYRASQVLEKDKNATIYNRIKTEDRKMILETMIILIDSM
jgi:hypothetical protein